MKEIIEVVSHIFNRGFVLGKCTGEGGVVKKHDLQAALKEEIENAAKIFLSPKQPVEPTADISRHCACHDGDWNKYCPIHGHGWRRLT